MKLEADPTLGRPVSGEAGAPPRLCPDVPFPPYRFVPGRAPHPFAHDGGWGRGAPRPVPPFVSHVDWRNNRSYLFGLDLFNRGWWWEAHEVWEELWHVVEGQDDAQHALLKGLIQLAACALNRERGADPGAERLLTTACAAFAVAGRRAAAARADASRDAQAAKADARRAAPAAEATLMGLDLKAVAEAARAALGQPTARVEGFYLVPHP